MLVHKFKFVSLFYDILLTIFIYYLICRSDSGIKAYLKTRFVQALTSEIEIVKAIFYGIANRMLSQQRTRLNLNCSVFPSINSRKNESVRKAMEKGVHFFQDFSCYPVL